MNDTKGRACRDGLVCLEATPRLNVFVGQVIRNKTHPNDGKPSLSTVWKQLVFFADLNFLDFYFPFFLLRLFSLIVSFLLWPICLLLTWLVGAFALGFLLLLLLLVRSKSPFLFDSDVPEQFPWL